MSLPFYFLLNLILVSRLSFTFVDQPLDRSRVAIVTAIQVAGMLAFKINLVCVLLAGSLILVNVLFQRLEARSGKVYRSRFQSLLVQVFVVSVFTAPWTGLRFNAGASDLLASWLDYSLLLAWMRKADWLRIHITMLGLLFVTNEANIMIRYLFQIWRLSPGRQGKGKKAATVGIGIEEYNTGRIIGLLERMLIYYLVLNTQFAAIGLILAAKSFTRYKELEKRAFAEYVLVGTLLSTLLATVTAGLIQLLLG